MKTHVIRKGARRRGAAVALTAVSGAVLCGFVALTVDVGVLYNARTELQRTADSAALAGATELLNQRLAKATDNTAQTVARATASQLAGLNPVQGASPNVDTTGDVVVGYLPSPNTLNQPIDTSSASCYNTVQVLVRRNETRNGPIDLFFARIFGVNSANLQAEAAATFQKGVKGWKIPPGSNKNAQLLPLALHVDYWNKLLAGTYSTGDSYSYDSNNKTVATGSDGILELNLYPGSGGAQLPPGNFGTVNIGPSNNSTCHLSSQIRNGVTSDDLAYYPGGELKLGADGTLLLNGDTGLSAGIKDDLDAIKGQPRAIPLFNKVAGNGNNANYTIVGFAGVRILNVKLTGSMSKKCVIIQPANLMDGTSEPPDNCPGPGCSANVYYPVHLTR